MYFRKIPHIIQLLFPKIIWKGKHNLVYLSFDDGPNPDSTPYLLDFLKARKIKASFFCLGEKAEQYPDLVKRIQAEGHLVANHGYTHLNGWKTKTAEYLENYQRGKKLLATNYFRPPYGKLSLRQYGELRKQARLYMWSHMPGDFDQDQSQNEFEKHLYAALNSGNIVCLHDQPFALKRFVKAFQKWEASPDLNFDILS